jgi:hypothetical protein
MEAVMTSKTTPAVPVGTKGGTDVAFFICAPSAWLALGLLAGYFTAGWVASGSWWWAAFIAFSLLALVVLLGLFVWFVIWVLFYDHDDVPQPRQMATG